MHIALPTYPDPENPGTPVADAVAVIAEQVSRADGSGAVTVHVYRSLAHSTSGGRPLDRFDLVYGTWLNPPQTQADRFARPGQPRPDPIYYPRVPQIEEESHAAQQADPSLSASDAIAKVLYTHLLDHPWLVGATLVA